MIVLDDGTTRQNPNPIPYIGADNTHRAGDTVTGLTGVLDYGPINASTPAATDYRLHPVAPVVFTRANPRTAAPDPVGGNVKIASMNTLNYFTTIDTGALICGPAADQGCRGADNASELTRQRAKLVAALQAIDADVVGLMEMENTNDAATVDLAGAIGYAYVSPPAPGTDAIRVGLIYKPGTVTPVGPAQNYQTNSGGYVPLFDRPPLAQTFQHNATGELFTVVVNHFKSKGSCPVAPGDPDRDTGQGCWNAKRTAQANALLDFVSALRPTDPDIVVLGDLNSYGAEDPIVALEAGGLVSQEQKIPAASRYTYIFDGQSGNLDHMMTTPTLDTQVVGVTIWHINADEPSVIDYNTEFKPQDLFAANPYRASDHDPTVLGVSLSSVMARSIAGWVFVDSDGNGVREPGELAGRGSVLVRITQRGAPVGETRSVGTDGWYNYEVVPGAYCVEIAVPAGYRLTSPNPVCLDKADGQTTIANFGLAALPGATIGDLVWRDSNGNGIYDAGEAGIGGVTLALRANAGGQPAAVVKTAATDAAGAYKFTDVAPGSYFVDVTDEAAVLAGMTLSTGGQSQPDPYGPFSVTYGDQHLDADFGYQPPCGLGGAEVRGAAWHDLNRNGLLEAGEPGLAGVQICAEPLGHLAVVCVATNQAGAYRFCLSKHTYLVSPTTVPAGLERGQFRFRLPLIVRPGAAQENVNFDFVTP
jgi:hypothetical protein